jgi:hypothetical protein
MHLVAFYEGDMSQVLQELREDSLPCPVLSGLPARNSDGHLRSSGCPIQEPRGPPVLKQLRVACCLYAYGFVLPVYCMYHL